MIHRIPAFKLGRRSYNKITNNFTLLHKCKSVKMNHETLNRIFILFSLRWDLYSNEKSIGGHFICYYDKSLYYGNII